VGRPKKKRKRSKHEDDPFVKDDKLSKKGRTITCQSCRNIRHNKATCKGQGGNNVESSGSASRQAQQAEPTVVTKTRHADGRELSDDIPTQSSAEGGASEWSFMSFKKILPLAEEIIVMIHKCIQNTKATSYKAKLMNLEDDIGWYTNEMRAHAEKIVNDLRDIAYHIVKKAVKKIYR
ncbi:hypothetical protein Tco_0261616, partial [Tanacetum coccineum]